MKLPAEIVARLRPAYEDQSVCVTGGAGFIGGHTVDALVSLGAKVSIIDDLSNSSLDHIEELVELDPARVRFLHASILDTHAMAAAVQGCTTVFHLAAIGSVPRSIREPRRTFDVNATGTVAVLEAARAGGARRVVFASSSSVYGGLGGAGVGQPAPRREDAPVNPLSPYAASKAAGEAALRAWCRAYGLIGVSLRYFNVFGPRQPADSAYAAVIPAFARALLGGQRPVVFGDGEQTRDFTFIANVVAANLAAGAADPLEGQAVNIGTGVGTSINDLARAMAQRCESPHIAPEHLEARTGDVRDSLADITLARSLLGYHPFADLGTGLDETVRWFRQAHAAR
jgi:nucleoside-diphosphate-sugar epimerase